MLLLLPGIVTHIAPFGLVMYPFLAALVFIGVVPLASLVGRYAPPDSGPNTQPRRFALALASRVLLRLTAQAATVLFAQTAFNYAVLWYSGPQGLGYSDVIKWDWEARSFVCWLEQIERAEASFTQTLFMVLV